MSLLCPCPAATALTAIVNQDCNFGIGQIQRIWFQRVYSSFPTKNEISADSTLEATWTALMAASNGTKVVVSPYLQNPTAEVGDARTYGGGNATRGGQEVILGRPYSKLTFEVHNQRQDAISTMRNLECESYLGVYFLDEQGRLWCKVDSVTSPTKWYPIPITSFFIGDMAPGGYESPDMNKMTLQLPPKWADLLYFITPAFDALVKTS